MTKTITYTGFIVSALLIVFLFISAKTYAQLAIAVILYPLLAYFALKVIPRRNGKAPVIAIEMPAKPARSYEPRAQAAVEVTDIDKRTFLKLIGAAGLSFFVFSLLGRRVGDLLFGAQEATTSSILPNKGTALTSQTTSPTEGYKISEIDDGNIISYYGFVNHEGAWFIMREDTEANSFRYARGRTDFRDNWADRENLRYDYYDSLF